MKTTQRKRLANRWTTSRSAIALLVVLASPLHAAAASFDAVWSAKGGSGCFARTYDSKHLASHPRQRLTSFNLSPAAPPLNPEPGTFDVGFRFTLQGGHGTYEGLGTCHRKADGVECSIEGDGGSFTMRADGSGLLLTIARMEVEGDADFSPNLAEGGDDRVVRLLPVSRAACPKE